jgi:hypothetical protein
MRDYTPDRWVILEITTLEETIQKVFAGWYGGFAGNNSWKLNSGITETRKLGEFFEFDGYSGSTYRCHQNNYAMSGLQHSILTTWQKQAKEAGIVKIRVLELDEVVVS